MTSVLGNINNTYELYLSQEYYSLVGTLVIPKPVEINAKTDRNKLSQSEATAQCIVCH